MPSHQDNDKNTFLLELQWAEGIRRGDPSAFEQMYRAYYSGLFRFVWHYVKSTESAEEIIQEVFARIWERRTQFDPAGSPKAYIFKSAKHLALDTLRHDRVVQAWKEEVTVLYNEADLSSADQLDDKLLLEDLQKAIKALPDRCRMAFLLSRYDGLSYAEIAEVMEISVNTVETQIARALRVLRKYLASHAGAIAFLSLLKEAL